MLWALIFQPANLVFKRRHPCQHSCLVQKRGWVRLDSLAAALPTHQPPPGLTERWRFTTPSSLPGRAWLAPPPAWHAGRSDSPPALPSLCPVRCKPFPHRPPKTAESSPFSAKAQSSPSRTVKSKAVRRLRSTPSKRMCESRRVQWHAAFQQVRGWYPLA